MSKSTSADTAAIQHANAYVRQVRGNVDPKMLTDREQDQVDKVNELINESYLDGFLAGVKWKT